MSTLVAMTKAQGWTIFVNHTDFYSLPLGERPFIDQEWKLNNNNGWSQSKKLLKMQKRERENRIVPA